MAEEMFMYAVTAGFFVAFAAIVFGARAKRYSSGYKSDTHGTGALSSGT